MNDINGIVDGFLLSDSCLRIRYGQGGYVLVAMQIEEPLVDVAAPSIEGIERLNARAVERLGEAA